MGDIMSKETKSRKSTKVKNKITKENTVVEKKEAKEDFIVNDNEITKLIKIVVAITVIVLLFYGITYFATKKPKLEEEKIT